MKFLHVFTAASPPLRGYEIATLRGVCMSYFAIVLAYVDVKNFESCEVRAAICSNCSFPLDRGRSTVLSFLRCAEIAQLVERWPSKP